jgi:hypothetical protein
MKNKRVTRELVGSTVKYSIDWESGRIQTQTKNNPANFLTTIEIPKMVEPDCYLESCAIHIIRF